MFRRSTIIVILFGLLIAAIIGYNQLLQNQPPLTLTIAVDPLAEAWVRAAAEAFNRSNARVNNGTTRVQVTVAPVIADVRVWNGNAGWTFQQHPTLWLPASSASLTYVPSNLPFAVLKPSLARTPLVWGGFASRAAVITQAGQRPLDWAAINDALAAGTWASLGAADLRGNVFVALYPASSSMAGVGALLSGAASLAQTATLTRDTLTTDTFTTWVDNLKLSQPRLVGTPAEMMAAQGAATINFALLPEVDWLTNLDDIRKREAVVLQYPAYQFMLDFPIALWDDASVTAVQRQGAQAFADFLASDAGQALARQAGLRPAASEPTAADALFAAGVPDGLALAPDYGQLVAAPARAEAERLLRAMSD